MNINPFIDLISEVFDLYQYVIISSIIMSWLISFGVVNRFNPVVAKVSEILYKLTEPLFRRIRRKLPDFGGIDIISPIIVLLGMWFIKRVLYTYFYSR
jgi:YggT family protein